MTPDWDWSFLLLVEKQNKWLKDNEITCCGERGWEAPLSTFNKNLSRYRLPAQHECDGCTLPAGTIEDGIHILVRLHPGKQGRALLREYARLREITGNICKHQLRKFLKETTGWLKLGGAFISPNWRLFTYWETFTGYIPSVDIKELKGDVDDWLTVTKHNGERIDEQQYISDLYSEIVSYLKEEWQPQKDLPTLEEWIATGVWMRGKAGTGRATTIKIESKLKRTRRYKGVDAALLSNEEIKQEMLQPIEEVMKVMQKSEGGKVRPVVVGGNALYRKMDFLSTIVERGLYGSKTSTLFAGSKGNEDIDSEWIQEVNNPNTLKVPLDQSAFDNHQSKSTILAALLAIRDICLNTPGTPEDYTNCWNAMWRSLTIIEPKVEMEGVRRKWENGIPSGWRWTALLDTILNIASFRVAINYYGKDSWVKIVERDI